MKKPIKIILIVLGIFLLMFCEYRFIIQFQTIEYGENHIVYSTIFGITDAYYVE